MPVLLNLTLLQATWSPLWRVPWSLDLIQISTLIPWFNFDPDCKWFYRLYAGEWLPLDEVWLWIAIVETGTDAMMHDFQMAGLSILKPKAMGHGLQSTSVYSCSRSRSNSSGWVRALILQMINALRDKSFGHTRLFSMCAQLLQTDREHLVYYWRQDAHVHA